MLNPHLLKKIREDPGGLVGSLEHLDLSSSNLGPADVFQLTKALNAHATHCGGVGSPIIGISLKNNNLCGLNAEEKVDEPSPPEYKGFQSFCRSLASNRYIRVLNVSENLLGAPGFKAIFDVLEATSSLHELILSGCETTTEIMKDMATALTKNKSVTHLDLSETSMCPEGVEYLMTALCDTYRSEVKTLLLGGNNLGVAGAKKIAKALMRPPRALVALNLESNGFGNEGASRICHALRSNKSIQHLDLSDNHIHQQVGQSLAQALSKNGTLIFLSISWNRLGIGGLLDLVPGLQSNTTLKYLNIIGNGGMPETGTALIEASLLANSSPVDIDIDHLPTRTRQEILSTDTKAVVADEDADDDGVEAETKDSARRVTTPSKAQMNV